ncbi:MAG: hypothetical protein ACLSG4_21185, partial [Anaerobutyricum sp.]
MLRNQMLGNSIADVVHRIKRIRLEELFLACASARAGAAFLYDRKLRPIIQKRSARKRTRRKGRWLPKQPRLGAR